MLILKNYVTRWWFLFVAQFVIMGAASLLPVMKSRPFHFEMLLPIALSWDLMRGLPRATLGLPIKLNQVSLEIWLGTVVVAGIVGSVAFGLSGLLSPNLSPGVWLFHSVLAFLFPGTLLFLLSGMPTRPSMTFFGKLRDGLFGALWGISFSCFMFIPMVAPAEFATLTKLEMSIVLLLGFFTISSFFTCRRMLVNRSAPRVAVVPSLAPTKPEKLETATGWRLWLRVELQWQVMVAVMTVLGMLVVMGVTRGIAGGGAGVNPLTGQLGFFTMIAAMPLVGVGIGSLRALRALPISHATITTLFVARPLVASLTIGMIHIAFSVVSGFDEGALEKVLLLIALGAIVAFFQSFVVRKPKAWLMVLLISFAGPLALLLDYVRRQSADSLIILLPLSIVPYAAAWLLHYRWLRSGSQIYRTQGWMQRFVSAPR
jgi:hypothetical protein